eukprot:gene10209-12080_t
MAASGAPAYKEVEDAYLLKHGITVVDKTYPVELLLPCAYIGTKAIFFEPTEDDAHYQVVHLAPTLYPPGRYRRKGEAADFRDTISQQSDSKFLRALK